MGLSVSYSAYELDFILSPTSSASELSYLREKIFATFEENRMSLNEWFADVLTHYGLNRFCKCPAVRVMRRSELKEREVRCLFWDPNARASRRCVDCRFSDDILCIQEERVVGNPELSFVLGTYDLAILWRCPTYFSSSLVRAAIRDSLTDCDIVPIPLHKVGFVDGNHNVETVEKGSSNLTFDHERNSVVAYVFLKLDTCAGPARIEYIVKKVENLGNLHQRNSIVPFLTFSEFPLLIKMECKDNDEFHSLFSSVVQLEGVVDSWTAYAVMTSESDKGAPLDWIEKGIQEAEDCDPLYLLFVNLAGSTKALEEATQKIEEILRSKRYSLVLVPEVHYSIFGYYDIVIGFRAPNPKDVIATVANEIRTTKGVHRCVTIPSLSIPPRE